jgi:hypothetical protein
MFPRSECQIGARVFGSTYGDIAAPSRSASTYSSRTASVAASTAPAQGSRSRGKIAVAGRSGM